MTSPELHTLDLFSCLYYAVCRHQTVFVCKLVTESAFYHCICLRSNFVSLTLFFTILVNIMPPSPSQNLPTSWEHQLGFARFRTLQLTLISLSFFQTTYDTSHHNLHRSNTSLQSRTCILSDILFPHDDTLDTEKTYSCSQIIIMPIKLQV